MAHLQIKHDGVIVSLKVQAKDIDTLKEIITKTIKHIKKIGYNEEIHKTCRVS